MGLWLVSSFRCTGWSPTPSCRRRPCSSGGRSADRTWRGVEARADLAVDDQAAPPRGRRQQARRIEIRGGVAVPSNSASGAPRTEGGRVADRSRGRPRMPSAAAARPRATDQPGDVGGLAGPGRGPLRRALDLDPGADHPRGLDQRRWIERGAAARQEDPPASPSKNIGHHGSRLVGVHGPCSSKLAADAEAGDERQAGDHARLGEVVVVGPALLVVPVVGVLNVQVGGEASASTCQLFSTRTSSRWKSLLRALLMAP